VNCGYHLACCVLPLANPFGIHTSAERARNLFRIRTSLDHSDLRIPKHLPSSNFSRNSFIFYSYGHARNCGKQTSYNCTRIRTYQILSRNSFKIRPSKIWGEWGLRGHRPPRSLRLSARHTLRRCHSAQLLSFHTLPNSFVTLENLSPVFSTSSKLFGQNNRGGCPPRLSLPPYFITSLLRAARPRITPVFCSRYSPLPTHSLFPALSFPAGGAS